MSTLFTILGFALYLAIFTIILPYIPGLEGYKTFLSGPIWQQLIVLGVGLIIYFVAHLIIYKVSSKELEKVDF